MNHSSQSESKLCALQTLPRGPWPLVSSDAKRLECAQLAGAFRFMATTHVKKLEVFPLHEPPQSKREQALRTPNAAALSSAFGVIHRAAFGVRLACWRFQVHGLNSRPIFGGVPYP